jgi:DNA replication and repair protein RecF
LLISLILANARALAADLGRAPVILLDEVAAHLDISRRAALYDEICALGAQAIMTGTEAALFEAMGDRGSVVVVRDDHGMSRIAE